MHISYSASLRRIAIFCALFGVLAFPTAAYAAEDDTRMSVEGSERIIESYRESTDASFGHIQDRLSQGVSEQVTQIALAKAEEAAAHDKLLSYDPALIAQIGTQASTGHSICCPSFACAYGDAIIDGTVNSHSYYGCGNCRWPNWGGGNSSYRSVDNVLREAYDQIRAGKPTVIHVRANYGQHWITLIGYQGVEDPDNLTLSNFIALDPWDGSQLVAGSRFWLYGDGCEHISDRA